MEDGDVEWVGRERRWRTTPVILMLRVSMCKLMILTPPASFSGIAHAKMVIEGCMRFAQMGSGPDSGKIV